MTVKLRRNWTLVTLMNVACACVSACVPVPACVCVEACANRRRNAIKWKLLKKAKMRNENSRHTLHCSPAAHHTHSLSFSFSHPRSTMWPGSVCTVGDFALITQKNMFRHVAWMSPCFSFHFSQIFLLILCFLLQFESDPWSRGSVAAVYEATPLLLYRINSNPKHVPT